MKRWLRSLVWLTRQAGLSIDNLTSAQTRYLPDDADGRALFDMATRAVRSSNPSPQGVGGLGDMVAVPFRGARARWLLHAQAMFDRLTPTDVAWDESHRQVKADVIIWCTPGSGRTSAT